MSDITTLVEANKALALALAKADGRLPTKEIPRTYYDQASRLLAAGWTVTPPGVDPSTRPPRPNNGYVLTARQHEILVHMAAGRTAAEISKMENISVHTTYTFIKQIRARLGAGNQLQAVVIAREQGLLP